MPSETAQRLIIGLPDSEHLTIQPTRRSHPDCDDYWDGNWITCAVTVKVGGFRAKVDADLRAEELASFRGALAGIYEQLAGEAVFETMEGWLTIRICGDGRGHFEARCELCDEPGIGNRLFFKLSLDQTYLPTILQSLDNIMLRFPVIGRP